MKLLEIGTRGLSALGVLFMAWMTFHSFRNAKEWIGSPWTTAGLLVVAGAVVVGLGYVIHRFLSKKQALLTILAVAAGLRLGWILYIDTQPVSDFLDMVTAAQSMVQGDFSFGTSEYYTRWVYQLGFTTYEALLLWVFGGDLIVLKVFNVLFSTGVVALVYATASFVFGEWCGRIAGLAFALYVPQIMMCSVLTNQHISTFFFFLGLYLLVRDQGMAARYRWLLIGLCFGIGNLMRPLGSVFLAACLVYVVLVMLLSRREEAGVTGDRVVMWKSLGKLGKLAGVFLIYALVQQAASLSLQAAGVTPYPLSNTEPYYKFMVGLNQETNGGWSQEDNDYVTQYPIGDERNEATRLLALERLEDKSEVLKLLVRKLEIMWGDEDSAYMWSLWQQDRPELGHALIQVERIQYVMMSVFGWMAMLTLLFTKKRQVERQEEQRQQGEMLFVILVLGYAAIHIVIEVQTRYRMDIMPALFILQSLGVYKVATINMTPRP